MRVRAKDRVRPGVAGRLGGLLLALLMIAACGQADRAPEPAEPEPATTESATTTRPATRPGTGARGAREGPAREAPALQGFNGDGPINRTAGGVAVKGYDLLSFYEGAPVRGSEQWRATYGNATFYFTSEARRDRFAANPERYLPAFGGYCALGVAGGYKDDMHPEAYSVVNGRLYFNLSPGIHAHWFDQKAFLMAEAEANWPRIKEAPGHGPRDAR